MLLSLSLSTDDCMISTLAQRPCLYRTKQHEDDCFRTSHKTFSTLLIQVWRWCRSAGARCSVRRRERKNSGRSRKCSRNSSITRTRDQMFDKISIFWKMYFWVGKKIQTKQNFYVIFHKWPTDATSFDEKAKWLELQQKICIQMCCHFVNTSVFAQPVAFKRRKLALALFLGYLWQFKNRSINVANFLTQYDKFTEAD